MIINEGDKVPYNSNKIAVKIVFGVKMELTHKYRLRSDVHKTSDPVGTTYAVGHIFELRRQEVYGVRHPVLRRHNRLYEILTKIL